MQQAVARLLRHEGGVAVVELAMVLPVLIALYLGAFVASDMVACNRKVTVATREMTDVISRYVALQQSDVTTIMTAITQEMVPYDTSLAMVRISEVQVCAGGTTARVVWSMANANGTALTADTTAGANPPSAALVTLPANMFPSGSTQVPTSACATGSYFIYGEVSYPYTAPISVGFAKSMTFYENMFMSPRSSTSIGLT